MDRSSPRVAGGLVGRDHERDVLLAAIGEARPSGPGVVLRGPPGIGKSALLALVRAAAEQSGATVLSTIGVPAEARLPFAALHRLVRPVADLAKVLPEPQRVALSSAIGETTDAGPSLFLVALATLGLLVEAAERAPVVVLVDDTQWLDAGSADVLAFVTRRIEAEPVTVVAAVRDGYDSGLLDAGLAELTPGPLDDAGARTLLDAQGHALDDARRERVLRAAQGNPLALVELATATGPVSPPDELPLTARLERAFAGRWAELPAAVRTLVLLVALDGTGLSAVPLAAAGRLAAGAPPNGLDAAVAAHLVESDGLHVRFRHPLIRSAVVAAATGGEVRRAHTALAEVTDPDRSAWHRAAAADAPDESVAAQLQDAAERAERRGAVAAAAGALERAAALSELPERRTTRLLRAGELAVELGRTDTVARLLDEVEPATLPPLERARLVWIRERFGDGIPADAERVRGLVADALRAAAERDVDLALDLLLGAAFRTWWHDPGAAVRDEVLAAVESLDVPPDEPRLVAVLAVAGPVGRGATVIERLARRAGGPVDVREAHPLGLAAHCVGASELAVALLSAAAAPLRAQGRLGPLAQVLTMHAWSAVQLGEWTGIGPVADEAERLCRETGQPLWHAGAAAARAALAGVRGDTEEAWRIAVVAERAALPSRSSNLLTVTQVARGLTALSAGQHEAALHHLLRVFDPDDGAHHYAERHGALGYLVEAAVHCGQHERARALVAELEPVARRTPASLLHMGLLYARPVLAPDSEAEHLFTAALATDLGHRPFLRARLQLAFGVWLRRARRITESRAPLRAARDTFDALGAAPWGERVRRELRASGEASGQRPPAPRDALTPQELQIARLAAAGASNREIGAQLFVSPRTVAAHLYRAFPKLGITSRAQLSTALASRT